MSRARPLLSQALLRPIHLLVLGVGLLLALTWAPWWTFPVSVLVYAGMVAFSLRDPEFLAQVRRGGSPASAGQPLDWAAIDRELGRGPWTAPLARIAEAERNLLKELAQAPAGAQAVLASTLAQLRSAAGLGAELARRLRSLDDAIKGYAGMNPEMSRREAADKRARAERTADEGARRALVDAASALEESARSADSLRNLRERTAAQLEGLSAMLESVAVRGVRLRVSSGDGPEAVAETLHAEMDAVRETLGVFESMDEPMGTRGGGQE